MAVIESLIVIATVVYLLYWYGTSTFRHWKDQGVRYNKPYPFVGSNPLFFWTKDHPTKQIQQVYDDFEGHELGGVFVFKQPTLVLRDPELIKLITVKDFDHFTNRNAVISEEADPVFGKNLLSLRDNRWRDMRNTLSPAFTASKMKAMFYLVNECASQMTAYIDSKIRQQVDNNHPDGSTWESEFKSFFTKFTNDVIATTAFGVQVDSLRNPENEFYNQGVEIMKFKRSRILKFIILMAFPKFANMLKLTLFGQAVTDFFRNLIHSNIKTREESNIVRPDLIHLLMQARKGTLVDDTEKEVGHVKADLTNDDITAQAVLFFFAGFETSSTALCFTTHELAVNPDVQERLQKEIDEVVAEDNGEVTYNAVMTRMPYLDMVLNETLRLWTPGFLLDRTVSKPYTIPKTDDHPEIHLKRDDTIWIPVFGLHRDPKNFPNPEKFDPERFSEENKNNIKPFTYLPFGSGPRNCVGMRFALMEVKTCLVHLIRKYNFKVTKNTQVPMKLDKNKANQMIPENGFMLGLEPRT